MSCKRVAGIFGWLVLVNATALLARQDFVANQESGTRSCSAGARDALNERDLEVRRRAIEHLIASELLQPVPAQHLSGLQQTVCQPGKSSDPSDQWVTAEALPMDLTLVVNLLSAGRNPVLSQLQQEQFEVMEHRYQRTHVGNRFPESFADVVYQMRSQGIPVIPEQDDASELQCMQRFKMVLVRLVADAAAQRQPRWYFRHDKIMDFFIVQSMMRNPERMDQHLSDPRFRGVYFLLATMLPLDQALALRERLIRHASDNNDTSLLRPCLELLEFRRAA